MLVVPSVRQRAVVRQPRGVQVPKTAAFHDRERFYPRKWGKSLRDHGNPAFNSPNLSDFSGLTRTFRLFAAFPGFPAFRDCGGRRIGGAADKCSDCQSASGPGPPGSGCSHQTTLPVGVRRAPQRWDSWRTTCRPRPVSSSLLAWRRRGSAAALSSTSQTSARSLTRRSVTSPREYRTALVTSSETSSSVVGIRSSSPQRFIGSAVPAPPPPPPGRLGGDGPEAG